ncbi:hypothetical protein ACS5NO_10765 [Larkinella sp. GY13]|uniref:hypothetical protein n=1 Tax=Larkinella sp. GY13 TaxID=3453720 RepID=UPI003EEFB6F1
MPLALKQLVGKGIITLFALKLKLTKKLGIDKILGIGNGVGILEKGKCAMLVALKGDLLDMWTNVIERAYIQGCHINLDDKHKRAISHVPREIWSARCREMSGIFCRIEGA